MSGAVLSSTSDPVRAGDFDVQALFDALDRQRQDQGLSWKEVAEHIWRQSSELNDRRRDHPIATSTITGMPKRNAISCQHALFMLRWIGKTPEDFLPAPAPGTTGTVLPPVGPDRRLRWSLRALYDSLDARRREQHLTWKEVAHLLACTPTQLTGLRTAKFATGMMLAMRITQWLGCPAAAFVYAARW
jgi:hypothetical protein